jgi:hypothetical protein
VSRKLMIFAGWIVILSLCAPLRAQDSPSLGDLARQNRKDNSATPAHRVITDDDVVRSAKSDPFSAGSAGPSRPVNMESARQAISNIEGKMKQLELIDRAALVKIALQGQDANFPGRQAWEDKLWDAKLTYIQRGRELVKEANQILTTAQELRNPQDGQKLKPDDPKVQAFLERLKQMVQNALRADAAFQAVVIEGWDLSKLAAPRRESSVR